MRILETLIREEWPRIKQAPVTSFLVLIVGIVVGFFGASAYFSDRMSDQNERMIRLRIAAGLDKPSAKTLLIDLTNQELKLKAFHIVERIREIVSIHQEHRGNLLREKESKKLSEQSFQNLLDHETQRSWRQFESIRVDALMISDELRNRISPHVHEKIVTATPHFRSADDPKALLSFTRLATGPFLVDSAVFLAGEIEELSKLQLGRLEVCMC